MECQGWTSEYYLDDIGGKLLNMNKGLTLIELMISIVMLSILAVTSVYILRAVLLSWSSAEERSGIDIVLDRGIEEMVRDLREAKEIKSTSGYDEKDFHRTRPLIISITFIMPVILMCLRQSLARLRMN